MEPLIWLICISVLGALFLKAALHGVATALRKRIMTRAGDLIGRHIKALVRKRAQMLSHDDYGNITPERWIKEVEYFTNNVVRPALSERQKTVLDKYLVKQVHQLIEDRTCQEQNMRETTLAYDETMTPNEFENFCMTALRNDGWIARTTGASGDQGCDVFAERGAVRLVVQCKKWSSSVGNSAVQEAFAARQHQDATHAAVVSNAPFTRAARDLANTTGVMLMHPNDLGDIWELVQTRLKVQT